MVSQRAALLGNPLLTAPRQALLAIGAAAVLLGAGGFSISVVGSLRSRRTQSAVFAALGVGKNAQAGQLCLEQGALGATTVDVRHIDFLAADSHKWMLGPLGAGIFYVLMANDGGRTSGPAGRATSLVDIAPTIAAYLGLPLEGFDGSPLPIA